MGQQTKAALEEFKIRILRHEQEKLELDAQWRTRYMALESRWVKILLD